MLANNSAPVADSATETTRNRWASRALVALLSIQGSLLVWISAVNSPNIDEVAHLVSGVSHWATGRFDLYRVNPPLVRMVAVLPLMLRNVDVDLSAGYSTSPYARSEFNYGRNFVRTHGSASFWDFTYSRWMLIPLCLVGGWTTFQWANELYGHPAGIVAVAFYCACPNLLAWGASITPDAVAASLGVTAAYFFGKWFKEPNWQSALYSGCLLGVCELTKSTWLLLFAVWPLLWLVTLLARRHSGASVPRERAPLRQLIFILFAGLMLINGGYGFAGSFQPLKSYRFISESLSDQNHPPHGGNRFAEAWIGNVPVPFPEDYVRGIDVQRFDFEQGKWSYLRGEQRRGGWWYYYLYCAFVKTPVGALALFAIAVYLVIFWRRNGPPAIDEIVVILPMLALFLLVSSQTGFNRHFRYVLPALPFFYILLGRTGAVISRIGTLGKLLVCGCVVSAAIESLLVYPHEMSFFNLLAGGPERGQDHLLDSNIDWGQDLLFLQKWYERHPQARPLNVAYFGDFMVDPRLLEPDWHVIKDPRDFQFPQADDSTAAVWKPGWYAVSVNYLLGYRHFDDDLSRFDEFQKLQPADRAGYSIHIFQIPPPPQIDAPARAQSMRRTADSLSLP